MARLQVHHFGPSVGEIGGIATVLRTYETYSLGADDVVIHPTWSARGHGWSARLAIAAAAAILRLPRTAIVHAHLSERGSFVREGGLLLLARSRGLSTVASLHGAEFDESAERWPRLTRAVLRAARAITCLSAGVAERAEQLSPASVVRLVPNAVAIDPDSSEAGASDPLVLFAGEIGPRKGADVLHRAWPAVRSACPAARCVMAGPATDLTLTPEAGLETPGPLPPERVRTLIREARCVVLPSRAEALPMILLESMAAARPFVSTPVGGVPSLSAGGTLVPVGDTTALADALIRYLDDRSLASTVGQRGRESCARDRGIETVGRTLRGLYEQVSVA